MSATATDTQLAAIAVAIKMQVEVDRTLRTVGVKDLVGDYGELLVHRALGGTRTPPTTEGHDIDHPTYGRVQVKTRKWELLQDGSVRKEDRAVGFKKDKPQQFDWLCHVVLDVDYRVIGAVLVRHACVWPHIIAKSLKVKYGQSCALPSSVDITERLRTVVNGAANAV